MFSLLQQARSPGEASTGNRVEDPPNGYTPVQEEIHEEEFEFDPEPLTPDLYGVGITSLIRDVRKVALGEGRCALRIAKAFTTVAVLCLTIAMQVFLMFEFKRLITQRSVHEIRLLYNDFEMWMYEDFTEITSSGFHRGIMGHFNADRFDDMPDHIDKEAICSTPLSQPYFFICILMIWSFRVVDDLRQLVFYMDLLLKRTDTISSVRDMLEENKEDHTVVLRGLTLPFKALLLIFIFIPRLVIDLVLLWLGCRWLTATASFGDVLLNAIALEFVLLMKDLVYNAVVPKRNQWETGSMLVPHKRKAHLDWKGCMGAFAWLIIVIAWVLLYVFKFQQVLPDYRWDIHQVCESYIDKLTTLTSGGHA